MAYEKTKKHNKEELIIPLSTYNIIIQQLSISFVAALSNLSGNLFYGDWTAMTTCLAVGCPS